MNLFSVAQRLSEEMSYCSSCWKHMSVCVCGCVSGVGTHISHVQNKAFWGSTDGLHKEHPDSSQCHPISCVCTHMCMCGEISVGLCGGALTLGGAGASLAAILRSSWGQDICDGWTSVSTMKPTFSPHLCWPETCWGAVAVLFCFHRTQFYAPCSNVPSSRKELKEKQLFQVSFNIKMKNVHLGLLSLFLFPTLAIT